MTTFKIFFLSLPKRDVYLDSSADALRSFLQQKRFVLGRIEALKDLFNKFILFPFCRSILGCVDSVCGQIATILLRAKEFFCLIGIKTIRNSVTYFNEIMLPAFSSFMENACCFVVRTKKIFNRHTIGNNTI